VPDATPVFYTCPTHGGQFHDEGKCGTCGAALILK
jgi:hypothetical protein